MKYNRVLVRSSLVVVSLLLLVALLGIIMLSDRDKIVLLQRQKTIAVGGVERHYLISLPAHSMPTKLVIGLHGFGDSPRKFAYYTGLHNVAGEDTVVVYPSAVKPPTKNGTAGWNAGFCCGSGWLGGVDDVGFIQKLIKDVSGEYGITSKDTFLVGFSNGSFMAERFAADQPGSIGGVVMASGTIGTTAGRIYPHSPVPILIMHGEADETIPLRGGKTASNPDFNWLPHTETLSAWQNNNGDKAPTKSIIYTDSSHVWYDWRIGKIWHRQPQASVESINFLKGL